MKQIVNFILLILTSQIFLLNSCTLEKRVYLSGYNFKWIHNSHNNVNQRFANEQFHNTLEQIKFSKLNEFTIDSLTKPVKDSTYNLNQTVSVNNHFNGLLKKNKNINQEIKNNIAQNKKPSILFKNITKKGENTTVKSPFNLLVLIGFIFSIASLFIASGYGGVVLIIGGIITIIGLLI